MIFTSIGIYLLLIWLIVTFISLRLTRDIASPQLMFCASLFFFFFDIFLTEHSIYMYGIYIISLLIILASSFINQPQQVLKGKFPESKSYPSSQLFSMPNYKIPVVLIWLASLPSILAMIYLIIKFDGIFSYIVAAQHGTKSFAGMGPLKTIISTFYPISLYYFALLISTSQPKKEYIFFLAHFGFFISLALLSLSRGTLLTQFIFMGLVWHFSRKRLSTILIASSLILLLSFASIYGVIRETINSDDGRFTVGLEDEEQKYKSEWMEFGIFPFEQIMNATHVEKHWGSTYVTIFTNFIPRSIWPEKPDPGGVIFTNEYAPGLYDEYSHYTTGLYPEAIINFGRPIGLIIGALQLALICFLLSIYYRKILFKSYFLPKSPKNILRIVIYVYVTWGAANILTGEITSVVIGTIIKIIVVISIFNFFKISFRPKRNHDKGSYRT